MTHYIIDGYNWLFRILNSKQEDTLKIERERIIRELSSKLSMAGMEATLVFDSHFNPCPAERSTSKGIAIYFTDGGQTADEYILEFIKYASRPQDYTIVTSDHRLAWAVRQKQGHSLSIQEFKKMLDRIYLKKQHPKPKEENAPPKFLAPKKTLQSHYEDIFTKKLKGIAESPSPLEQLIRKPMKKKEDKEQISDFERWKQIFDSGENSPDG
ncbi:MAG: NYN domain-containing protein [Chlamydiales bacterium]